MIRRLFSALTRRGAASYERPVFAQAYCPLEVLAEETGEDAMEALIAHSPGIRKISDSLVRFLDDEDGARALKKGLHITIEERMRSMAVTLDDPTGVGLARLNVDPGPHPLDRHCAVALGHAADMDVAGKLQAAGWAITPGFPARTALQLKVWGAAALTTWRAFSILVGRGAATVEPRQTTALISNFWSAEQFEFLADAAATAGFAESGQMTIWVDRDQPLPTRGYDFIRPGGLRVPRSQWARNVLLPTVRLALSTVRRSFTTSDATLFAAFEAMRIAAGTLHIWPVAMNVRCRTVSDVVDYLPAIVTKGAIFRKSGAKLVRWPTTQIDTFGCLFANAPHDFFVASGHYFADTFSRNWRVPGAGRAIGLVQADRRLATAQRVDPDFKAKIDRMRQDKKLLAFFGHSPETGVTPMLVSSLRAVIEVLQQNPEWFLVVKSKRRLIDPLKGRTAYMEIVATLPEYPDWAADDRIIFVDYADETREVCPSGWLAEVMDLGTGDHGSIVGECVARNRPYCSYAPIVYRTPFKEKLQEAELLITDIDRFKIRLGEAMQGNIPALPRDWAEWAFDPYQDDRALERLAMVILDQGEIGKYGRESIPR